jgi:hypothetical protein
MVLQKQAQTTAPNPNFKVNQFENLNQAQENTEQQSKSSPTSLGS